MKAPSPAFRLYPKDWLVDTARLSLAAQGAYMRLLCHMWAEGSLPGDVGTLARIVSVSASRWHKLWAEIGYLFVAEGGQLRNRRLEEERDKQIAYHTRHSDQAREAAIERWRKAKGIAGSITPSNAKGMLP